MENKKIVKNKKNSKNLKKTLDFTFCKWYYIQAAACEERKKSAHI